jgi:WhiB family redox-sensing transcriptional regulator
MDWSEAVCAKEDPNLFFPEGNRQTVVTMTEQAKRLCASCPIAAQCLEVALRDNAWGIWGGTTMKERKSMLTKMRRGVDARRVKNLHIAELYRGRFNVPDEDENTIIMD